MRIERMRLKNFRKFRSAEAEFGNGIISINGLNGAGKSTLVEAIAWALYGNDKRILRDRKEGVKSALAGPSDICSVELDFEMDGNHYHLVREMRGKAGTVVAEISMNGMVQASTNTAVNEYIEKVLGMDADGFLISVFARQKELNALSNLTKEERKRKIERMLGLDAIDAAKKMISSDKNEIQSYINGMRGALYGEDGRPVLDGKRVELERMKKEMEETEKALVMLRKEHESLLERLKAAEEEEKRMRELRDRYTAISSDVERLRTYIAQRKRDVEDIKARLEDIEKKKRELEALKDAPAMLSDKREELERMRDMKERARERNELDERKKRLDDEIQTLESKIKEMKKELEEMRSGLPDISEMEKRKKELLERKKDVEKKRNKAAGSLHSIGIQIKEIEKSMKDIEGLGPDSKCPTCHRPLGIEYEGILEHMKEEKENLLKDRERYEQVKKEAEAELSALEEEVSRIDKGIRDASRMESSISSFEAKIDGKAERLESMKKEREEVLSRLEAIGEVSFDPKAYESLRAEIEDLMEKERAFQKLSGEVGQEESLKKRLLALEDEIEEYSTQLEVREKELAELGFSESALLEAEERRKRVQSEEREMHGRIMASEEKLKAYEREMSSAEKEIERLEREMEALAENEEELSYLKALEKYMKEFRDEAITKIRPTLQAIASDFFARMTDGKYPGIELDDEYRIKIIDTGVAYPIERFSGGESDLANLCLRLAISEVVVQARGARGFNFMVLDEIFGSQDVTRRENIIKALQSLSGRFSQIFLISHIEGIKESASMVLMVVENEDGSSEIRVE